MKRHACATAVLLAVIALMIAGAPSHAGEGRIVHATVPSPVLGRAIPYVVYLPERTAAGEARVPVLYLLHGRGDDETTWLSMGNIGTTLDRKLARAEIGPLIVVMPMAAKSWYVDDTVRAGGSGPVARAFLTDLPAAIEARYPQAAPCRAARAVGGLSMGGYGAMLFALDRPDLFAAAFSLSGSLFSERPDEIELRRVNYERIYEGVFGTPFDVARFLQWNVFARLDRPREAVPAIWLSAGDKDFPAILAGTVRLHQELRRRNLPSELRISAGAHDWDYWKSAVEPALEWLTPRLDATCGAAVKPDQAGPKPPADAAGASAASRVRSGSRP